MVKAGTVMNRNGQKRVREWSGTRRVTGMVQERKNYSSAFSPNVNVNC